MLVDPREGGHGEGEVERAEERLDAWLDKRRGGDGPFAHAQPADPTGDVGGDGHPRHRLDGYVADDKPVVEVAGGFGAPDQVADEVVFADVGREEIDAPAAGGLGGGDDWVLVGVGEALEVGFAEHVALAYETGGDADGVDGAVEFGVAGGHEHLLEAAAAAHEACLGAGVVVGGAGQEALGLLGVGRLYINHEGQLVHEFVGGCS